MPTKRDLSDFVKFLKMVGLWPYLGDGSNRIISWFQIFRLVFFTKMVTMWILSAYIIESNNPLGAADFLKKFYAGMVLSTPYMVIQTIYIFCNGHHLQSFVSTMAATLKKRKEPWQRDILNGLLNPLWKVIRISGFYCLFLVTVAFYGPILYDTVSTTLMDAEPLNFNVTIDGLLPPVKKSNFLYYFLQWYNALLQGFGLAHFIGLTSITPLIVSYIRVEIRILCRKIDEFSRKENSEKEAILKEIIEDHINIMRLTELTNKFIAAPLILQNVAAAAAITLFAYAMTNSISQGNDSITALLFNFNSPIAMTMVVFLSCYSGEMLQSESLNIYDGFCQIQWYNMPKRRQKDILIILMQVQRPLCIKFKGSSVDLRAFKQWSTHFLAANLVYTVSIVNKIILQGSGF